MAVEIETTLTEIEELHVKAHGRGDNTTVSKETLGRLLRDHHRMFRRLQDINEHLTCINEKE